MITVVQRVNHGSVMINDQLVAAINQGLLILCGFEKTDKAANIERMLNRVLNYRIFSDDKGKMNLSLNDIKGGLLLVPQFTLVAETKKGLRPGFSYAATPEHGEKLFADLIQFAKEIYSPVSHGVFGADMQVNLTNDGPVTFIMQF